jgi:S-formylglutathione hydrolase
MTILNLNRAAFLFCICFLAGLLALSPASGQTGVSQSGASPQVAPPGSSKVLIDTIPAPSLAGNLFGDPTRQQVAIYLPPSYSTSSARYPVVYFLPGFDDAITAYLDGAYQGFRLQAATDSLIRVGAIKEMIVVIVNGRNQLGGSFYANSSAIGNWEDFIVAGLVTFIDSHYRTVLSPGSRAIAGHSMGGSGALNIGMHHPDIFGCVYAMSPGLFDENGLSESPMFVKQQSIRNYLGMENSLKPLSRQEASARFGKVMDSLVTSRRWDLIFTLAYGAAFSAHPGANAPHIDYPYTLVGDSLVLDSIVWKQWDKGFGNLGEKIAQYREMSSQVRALAIEYGTEDEYTWIPPGCKYFSELLTEKNIPHQLIPFVGHHQDSLGMRLTRYMLPFCSDNLLVQRQKTSQTQDSNHKAKSKPSKSKRKK